MVKTALSLVLASWILLLIGIVVIGLLSHLLGNPWLLIITGVAIVAVWSIIVYRVAKWLVARRIKSPL